MKNTNDKPTSTMALVLAEILSRPSQEHWGRNIVERGGISAGRVHPILRQLELCGWLTSRWEEEIESERPLKRLYRLTKSGRLAAESWVEEYEALSSAQSNPSVVPVYSASFPQPQTFDFS